MKARISCLIAWVFLIAASLNVQSADKWTVQINGQTISAWRTVDLESAKKEAAAQHKPIAWIASAPQVLDGRGTIDRPTQRGATLHEFYAFRDRTVLVFEDAYKENHQVLSIVDAALHTPDPHYVPPKVIFLNPDATEVLATVEYEPDFVKRAKALAAALKQAEDKMSASQTK